MSVTKRRLPSANAADRLTRIVPPRGASMELLAFTNQINRTIGDLQAKIRELHHAPKLRGDLDMNGFRIRNVGRTKDNDDVPPRGELIDKALYDNGMGQHIARSPIISTSGIRGKRWPTEPDEMATVGWVRSLMRNPSILTMAWELTTLSLSNGLNNDVELGNGVLYAIRAPSADFGVTGMLAAASGRIVVLYNATAFKMRIYNQHVGSATGNRISTLASNGSDILTTGPGAVAFFYDDDDLQWVVFGMVL